MKVQIKICGITNLADALKAAELGADAIGLNFYPGSPRCVTEEVAAAIVRALPPFVEPIGLFVKTPREQMIATMSRLGLRTAQWHTDRQEPLDVPFRLIPAFPVRDADSLAVIEAYLDRCAVLPAALLVDAHVPGAYGGTGQVAPWELLAAYRPRVPLILAGGLTPDNVAEAVRVVKPYAVDVASGVESAPGIKDAEKVRAFVAACGLAL